MIAFVLVLVVIGVAVHLLKSTLPIDPTIMVLINTVIVITVVWALLAFAGIDPLSWKWPHR